MARTPRRTTIAKRPPKQRVERSRRRPDPGIAQTVLGIGWDGKSVDALRLDVRKDHKRRAKSAKSFNAWDERLVCTYVLRGMTEGRTETRLLLDINLDYPSFWQMLKRQFLKAEFLIARKIQARALADISLDVARGVDEYSAKIHVRLDAILRKEFRRALRRMKKHKNHLQFARDIVATRNEIKELDRNLIARNRLMIDQHRWMAKTNDPQRFGDKTALDFGGSADGVPAKAITVQFVDAKGKAMKVGT